MLLKTVLLYLTFSSGATQQNITCEHTLCSVSHKDVSKVEEWRQKPNTVCEFSAEQHRDADDEQAVLWQCFVSSLPRNSGACQVSCQGRVSRKRVDRFKKQVLNNQFSSNLPYRTNNFSNDRIS